MVRAWERGKPATMFVVLLAVVLAEVHGGTPPPYKEYYMQQTVDHFNYQNQDVFGERYLLVDQYFKGTGPLFFYTGNEGAIEGFYDNSGFVFELASDFNALVVFAEHRYYGKSLPYGQSTFEPKNMGYLSVAQALADYSVLIANLRSQYDISRVIAFGGSYGGMLSAWFRFKYPNAVDGALAASAPIFIVDNLVDPTAFFGVVTQDYESVDARCPVYVRNAFSQILSLAQQGASGLQTITKQFLLCDELTADKVNHLIGWVRNSFTSLAMVDYPYAASFLAPLPAYPVNVSCNYLLSEPNPLRGLALAAGLFYNGTGGTLKCFNITDEFIECADPTGCGLGPDSLSWDYQACTELTLPCSTNNITDMFPPTVFDPSAYCKAKWGVEVRPGWTKAELWGKDILSASNIIFSNGNLDPWHIGGVVTNLTDTLRAVYIQGGAHHLDLRFSTSDDPQSVTFAREQERDIISMWLTQ
eukprot:Em0041g4a